MTGCGRLGFSGREGGDGGGDDAAPATCTALAITDDFEDGVTGPQWTEYGDQGVTVAETGGELQITLAANLPNAHYGGYVSTSKVDLRDHCFFVTEVSVPAQMGPLEMQMSVRSGALYTGYSLGNGNLQAFTNFNGAITVLASLPYDPVAQHVVRVREAGGTTSWDISSDGVTYTNVLSAPTPFDFSSVLVLIDAGTYDVATNPGTAVFDNFDLP